MFEPTLSATTQVAIKRRVEQGKIAILFGSLPNDLSPLASLPTLRLTAGAWPDVFVFHQSHEEKEEAFRRRADLLLKLVDEMGRRDPNLLAAVSIALQEFGVAGESHEYAVAARNLFDWYTRCDHGNVRVFMDAYRFTATHWDQSLGLSYLLAGVRRHPLYWPFYEQIVEVIRTGKVRMTEERLETLRQAERYSDWAYWAFARSGGGEFQPEKYGEFKRSLARLGVEL